MAQSRGRQHHNNGSTYPRHPLGKRSLAFTLNLKRRHLNREQRRALIAESLKSDPQLSNREHARRTGAHQTTGSDRKTIMKDVRNAEVVQSGPPESENVQVTGTDGKTYTPKPRDPEPEESPIPRWEDVGTVPPSKLKNLRPSPAPGISFDDVDELNQLPTSQPQPTLGPLPLLESKPEGIGSSNV